MKSRIFIVCIWVMLLAGCNGSIKQVFTSTTPYEEYVRLLEKTQLGETPMVQAWIAAGQRVFKDSVIVNLPFSEAGFFSSAEPSARAYHFDVREGQLLTVAGKSEAQAKGRLFVDLFVWKNEDWKQVEHSVARGDTTFQLTHEFSTDTRALLRLQPELLTKAYYTISLSPNAALINPVSGATNRSVGSLYGVDRDGGRRRHEGVDIFAPKGTPVIAPANGIVSRVGNNKLGGKVVWMQDLTRGQVYYFAHLDSQLVQAGKRVQQGDTLGLVGNTGNAKTTPPHLHFGIYQRGSKDPINYIRILEAAPPAPPLDTALMAKAFKVTASQLNLRSGPGDKHEALAQLKKNTYVRIIGHSGDWYRIALPDQREGFISKKGAAPIDKISTVQLAEPTPLLSEAHADAVPVAYLPAPNTLEVLAHFEGYNFVKTEDGVFGWVVKQ